MNPDAQLHGLLHCVSRAMHEDVQREVRRHGIQYVHWKILWYVSAANRYSNTVQCLVRFLAQTKGSVSQSLQLLERRGLIGRIRDEEDRRVVRLALTDDGRTILSEIDASSRVREAAGLLDTDRTLAAVDVLTELLRKLQTIDSVATFGICSSCVAFERHERDFRCRASGEALSAAESRLLCVHHTFGA